MVLMVLAGLWALIRGRITITRAIRLQGRQARLYGGTLLGTALVALPLIDRLLTPMLPTWAVGEGVAPVVVNLLLAGAIIIGLAIPFRERDHG